MYNINRRKFLGLFGCGCCSLILPSCSTVPITERRQLSIIPESRINRQAADAYEKFRSIRNTMYEGNLDIKLLTQALDVYAEDKSYVDTINSIIDTNEFTQFDLRSYIFTSS